MVFSCGADLHSKRFYPLIIVKYCSPLFRFDFGQLGKTVMLDAILGSKGDVGLLERTDSTIYNTLYEYIHTVTYINKNCQIFRVTEDINLSRKTFAYALVIAYTQSFKVRFLIQAVSCSVNLQQARNARCACFFKLVCKDLQSCVVLNDVLIHIYIVY